MVACKCFKVFINDIDLELQNIHSPTAFACHDQGCSSLAFAPQHQLLISAGKKGDVCIFDVRQRTLRHRFQVRLFISKILENCIFIFVFR
jgi:WD40 repeat protein